MTNDSTTWTTQSGTTTAILNTLSYDNADQLTKNVQSGGAMAGSGYNYDPAGNRLAELTLSGTTVTATTAGLFNNLNQLTATGTSTATTVSGTTNIGASSLTINGVAATISGTINFTAAVPTLTGTNVLSIAATPTNGAPIGTQRFGITLTGTTPTTLNYDLNGNTITDENGNTYTWDALNRLTKITYTNSSYTTMAYDGLNRRTQIANYTSTGTLTATNNFLWAGSDMAEERDATNTVTYRFFPQGEQQSGVDYYYTRDHLGSVREMCTVYGTVEAQMTYDLYGNQPGGIPPSPFQPSMRYAGYYLFGGLYLTRAGLGGSTGRPYDPNTGRWLSRDPIDEAGGLNLYDYVRNNSICSLDPLGLGTWSFTVTGGVTQVTYTLDAEEKKCCDSATVDRDVLGLFGYHDDNTPGKEGGGRWSPNTGVASAEPDNPNGFGIQLFGRQYRSDFNEYFRFRAVCTSGKDKGKVLSRRSNVYHVDGHVSDANQGETITPSGQILNGPTGHWWTPTGD